MKLTRDGVFHSSITVFQPARGYRFAVDSVLLGAFASRARADLCVDLGAGSGVLGFILLAKGKVKRVVGVEIDPVLSEAARLGAAANGLASFTLVEGDLRSPAWRTDLAGRAGLVVSNPPYFARASGRASPLPSRARARHDATCTLADVVEAASSCLASRGRLCLVLPPSRLSDLLGLAMRSRLAPSRLRPVYPRQGSPSRIVLIEVRRGYSGALAIEPPLFLHDDRGSYSAEAADILAGRFS